MQISVHCVVLIIEQPFYTQMIDYQHLSLQQAVDWFKKQQKYTDKSSETGNVRDQRERSQNGKTSGH
jgi:hypothetical protein